MDPIAARRTQAGAPVVHGVHAVAWALNSYFAHNKTRSKALHLGVRFDRFMYVGQTVEARLVEQNADRFLIQLNAEGAKVATLRGEVRDEGCERSPSSPAFQSPVRLARPLDREVADLVQAEGQFSIPATSDAVSKAFPSLTEVLGAGTVSSLISLSTLVGMHAPGLHSIFSKFSVRLAFNAAIGPLHYRVAKVQPVLRALDTEVYGAGLTGSVGSFVRRSPVSQPSSLSISGGQVPDCSGARVLIVGGSRGLGEVAAKLCAMGGADVTITYAVGAADAEAVRADIAASGGRCAVCRLDVTEPVAPQLVGVGQAFSHVYYFATSRIFSQKAEMLSREHLSTALDIHLYGFKAICEAVSVAGHDTKVFYPSSVAVDEKPKDAVEYTIAKIAGELFGETLNGSVPGLTVITERLPRTDTDQTATVLPVPSSRAIDVIRPIVARMHSPGREKPKGRI